MLEPINKKKKIIENNKEIKNNIELKNDNLLDSFINKIKKKYNDIIDHTKYIFENKNSINSLQSNNIMHQSLKKFKLQSLEIILIFLFW